MINVLLDIIGTGFLIAPLCWEIDNDKFGEASKDKSLDVAVRFFIAVTASYINFLFGNSFWLSFFSSLAIHFFFFDYIVHYTLIKNKIIKGHWYSYLGKTAWMDQLKWWIKIGPHGRFAVRALVIVVTLFPYFKSL